MSLSLLVSSTSVFISAGLATSIALYLRLEKSFRLKRILAVFLTRYSLFALFCLLYYFFYLKNGNSPSMKAFWTPYFLPLNLSAWPEYIRRIYCEGKSFLEFSVWMYIKCAARGMGIVLFVYGSWILWRKNRFILCALLLPVVFAALAGFFFYPFIIGPDRWSRLSLYIVPLQILIVGQALLPFTCAVLSRLSRTMRVLSCCALIALVLCVNIRFAVRGMGNEHLFPVFSAIISRTSAEDTVLALSADWSVWKYYTFLTGVDRPVTVLPHQLAKASDDTLEAFLSNNVLSGKKSFSILYTAKSALLMDRVKAYLEKQGCRVTLYVSPKPQ